MLAIAESYDSIIDALACVHTSDNEKGDTEREDAILQGEMEDLVFVFRLKLLESFIRSVPQN